MANKVNGQKKVLILKDRAEKYPDLSLDVFIVGDEWDKTAFSWMFAMAGCRKAPSIDKADLVVFAGGSDVNPRLYGEIAHSKTFFDDDRDVEDYKVFEYCLQEGIAMFGVCRGAQFLHVGMGGKLYQHVDSHETSHRMYDITRQKYLSVSSSHHQMVIPDAKLGIEVVGTAYGIADTRWNNNIQCDIGARADVEAFAYPEAGIVAVQGHPEYRGYEEFTVWSLDLLEDFIVRNTDFKLEDGFYRLQDCVKEERIKRWESMDVAPLDADRIVSVH